MRAFSKVRVLLAASMSLALAACGDSPTAPPRMSAEDVARVLPGINDARLRLVDGIVTPAVRERARSDIEQIELALGRQDAQAAGFRLRLLRNLLTDYASRAGSDHEDDADVVAIGFVLLDLSVVLGLSFDFALRQ